MTTRHIGQGFIGSLIAQRSEAKELVDKAKQSKSGRASGASGASSHANRKEPGPAEARAQNKLTIIGVPEKVAAKHLGSLAEAQLDAAAIAHFTKKLEPWRARSFHRVVEQFYKSLGLALDRAPAAPPSIRKKIAAESVAAFRRLSDGIGPKDQLVSAVSAAVGLFDLGVRLAAQGKLEVDPKSQAHSMEQSSKAVLAFYENLSDRSGLSTALNVFPTLVELAERSEENLTQGRRIEIWKSIAGYIRDAGPRSGFEQHNAAELASALTIALADPGKRPLEAAIADATVRFRAPFAQAHQDVLESLAARRVPGITIKSLGRPLFDVLNDALRKTADAHPTGPKGIDTAIFEIRRAAAVALSDFNPRAHEDHVWPAITSLIERFGATEIAKPLLEWTRSVIPRAQPGEDYKAAIERAVKEPDAAKAARYLAEAEVLISGSPASAFEGLAEEIAKIAKLPPNAAMLAALALSPALQNADEHSREMVHHVVHLASEGGKDDLFVHMRSVAERLRAVITQVEGYIGGDVTGELEGIAASVARDTHNVEEIDEHGCKLGQMLQSIHAALPRASLAKIAASDTDGSPGAWQLIDPSIRYRHDTQDIVSRIAGAIGQTPMARADEASQTEAARFAIRLTQVFGNIDGEYETPLSDLLPDITKAYKRPHSLNAPLRQQKGAAQVRRSTKPSVADFLRIHPELPLDLALSVGLYLSPKETAWLIDKLEGAKARDTKRKLRDFILGCINSNKTALIEAIVATDAPPKSVMKAVAHVARLYRADDLNEVPWRSLVRGFREDRDTVSQLEQKLIDETLKEAGLSRIPKAETTEEGLETIATCGEAIKFLFEHFKEGEAPDGFDTGRIRAPFIKALESVVRGTWPEPKYTDEAGTRQMAALTPEQQAIWREETVTPMKKGGAEGGDAQEKRRALALARGLQKAIRRDAKLAAPGLADLGWNKPSLALAQAALQQRLTELRNTEKGSPAHRALSSEMREVRDAEALLRLHYAIKDAGEEPTRALLNMRAELEAALPALSRQRLDGAHAIAEEILDVARDIKSSPRQGTYAVDEDGLEPLITSTTGGCIHYTEVRRWANGSLACNANEKIVRVYDGDSFVYRAIMRFHEAEMEGYKGPVLWLNQTATNGGSGEHDALLLRHALEKAKAMGIPLVSAYVDFSEAARALRLKQTQKNVTLKIDGGNTDALFTDYVFASDVRAQRGDAPLWNVKRQLYVVMPKR